MSLHEENKRVRSLKLIQLVYDRQIDSAISIEIRKLLEERVFIDFQDQSRNQKTAIHLAVEKCDVIVLKFLLQFRPSLAVKDGYGKTPVELAQLRGDEATLNVLLDSTVDFVNELYNEVFDFEGLTRQKIEVIKSRATFKVLKLTSCPSVNDVWVKLNGHDYATTLNESSHFFFISIETKEVSIQNDHKLMKKALKLRRPMIVQLRSSSSQQSKIYFKDDQMDFVEITYTAQMTQEEFDEAVQSDAECNFKLLVAALRSILFGHFAGDLLNTKLNINEDRHDAVNQFSKRNALCHRFFKLFYGSPLLIDTILATLSFKGDQSLLALLDLPFEPKDGKLKLNETQQDILCNVYSSGCNLLMLAVEQSNLDAVKLLLRCGCDFNHSDNYGNRASDICWQIKAFNCLAELIEAGSPYPYNFRLDQIEESSEAHGRINTVIKAIDSFHEHIEQGETEEVMNFIASHPHIKHAYDINNKSALTVALQSNRVDIYSLLMSEGFEPGADDEYRSGCSESKFKNEIRNSHRKYFMKAFDEPHLKRLSEKSQLSFGSKDRAKCSAIILKMLNKLNGIDELIPILKICSLSDKLRIVFDFNCDSVDDMDPTAGLSLGAVYPSDGFIYIGARNYNTEFSQVIGTLVHELTHYAMKLTYENSCKPYEADDIASTQLFEDISFETKKICNVNPLTDSIVTTVFTCYTESAWHQELIVRVPQLLAHYKSNSQALEAAERNTPELFHFFREKTLKDVERQSKALLHKHMISKINNQKGISRKIWNLNVQFEHIEMDLKPSVYIVTSNAPLLTLAMLNQFYHSDSHIFVSLEQIAIGNTLEQIAKVDSQQSSTGLIVDCIGQTQAYPETLRKLLKDIKNMKIALVTTAAESLKVKKNFSKIELKTFDHKWAELTENSKVHLLDQYMIFQGVEMKLNELVEPSSEAMNFFPLGELFEYRNLKIVNELHKPSHYFYIDRKLIRKGQENASSFEEFSQNALRPGAMIISDEAGSGKSVTLFEIAKNLHRMYPHRWVLFVDLKRHIEAFKAINEKIKTFEDFIVQNILKNEPKFERELFKQMFRVGKTFVLFDGFDEICPNYKDLLLHALKLFESRPGNHLFITTRPHLEADLEIALGNFVYKLEEFSEESQAHFLREYWKSVGFETNDVLSKRLLEKFSEIEVSNIVGLPLLLRMTAEIFDDPKQENLLQKVESLSISSVFREFVEKHLKRWKEKGNENEISLNENVEIDMAGGVLGVHHSIAINLKFDGFLVFDVDASDAEKILRIGLTRYDETERTFHFIHETFAEYFVADFISFHLNRKNRNSSFDCSMAIEVLVKVLCDHDSEFAVIKTFLDQILEAMNFNPNETFCKSVAKCLSKVLKSNNCIDILSESLASSQENLTGLLLSIAKHVEKDVLLKVLQSESYSRGSALHIAAANGSKAQVSTLCDIITNCIDNPKEIYQHEGLYGNVLFTAAHSDEGGVLKTLCAHLTKDEIKIMFHRIGAYGQNVITIASDNSNDEVFLEMLSLLPNYLSHDEIKSLLLAVDDGNHNFFHRAIKDDTSESLKLKFEVVKSNFDVEEQKEFFYQPATAFNMFHHAARNTNEKIFESVIEATRDVLSNDDIKSMMIQKDFEGSNVLHIVAAYGNEYVLNELNLLLRERLSYEEIKSLLHEVNEKGQNCFRLAANNTQLNFQVFCGTIGNLLPIEDQTRLLQQSIHEIDIISFTCGNYNTKEIVPKETIKQLLTKTNRAGWNVFQKVAYDGGVDTWNKLISFAQARFSADEMKSFLICDVNGLNCLLLAANNYSDKNMIGAICQTIKNIGMSVEEQKKFLRQKDSFNRNVFHQVAKSFEIDTLEYFSLYNGLSTIISNDEIKEMLKEKDSYGDNILYSRSTLAFHKAKLRDLIAFLKKIFTYDELKILLFDVNHDGQNFFHCAINNSTHLAIKSLSKAIKEILSLDDQKKFFGIKSPNLFHLAAESLENRIFSALHECLKDVLTKNEIESLILERDSKNENVLLSICRYDHEQDASFNVIRLREYLKVLKDICDADELKKFLTSLGNSGSTILLLAAQFKDHNFNKEVFGFIQSELSVDEQRDLIQKCDNDGRNVLTCASNNKIPEIFSVVKRYTAEILSEALFEELLKSFETILGTPKQEKIIDETFALKSHENPKNLLQSVNDVSWSQVFKTRNIFNRAAERKSTQKKWRKKDACYIPLREIPKHCEANLKKKSCRSQVFEDNFRFKNTSEFLPAFKNIIEVRPLFLECKMKKTSVIIESKGHGVCGSFSQNDPLPQNLRTPTSSDELKNVSRRESESSIDVEANREKGQDLVSEAVIGEPIGFTTPLATRDKFNELQNSTAILTRPPPQPPPQLASDPPLQILESCSSNLVDKPRSYSEKEFIDGDGNEFSIEALIQTNENEIVIISGEFHTRKKKFMDQIFEILKTRKDPNSIEYVNVESNIKDFREIELNNIQSIVDYFCLNYTTPNESRHKDFREHFLKNSATIIFYFNVNFHESIQEHSNLIRSIKFSTTNQLWVVIPPHLEQNFKSALESRIYKILDFSPGELKEFIRKNLKKYSEENFSRVYEEIVECYKFLTSNAKIETNLRILKCLISTFENTNSFISEKNYFKTFTKMMEKYLELSQSDVPFTSDLYEIAFQTVLCRANETIEVKNLVKQLFRNTNKLNNTEFYLCGLVSWTEEGKLFYTCHRIAEFLVAHFFFNLFLNKKLNEKDETALRLLGRFVACPSYVDIRKLLDDAFNLFNKFSKLEPFWSQREVASLNAQRIFSQEELHNIFHVFLQDGLPKFILNLNSLLSDCKDEEPKSLLFNIFHGLKTFVMRPSPLLSGSTILKRLWQFEDKQKVNTLMKLARHQSPEFGEKLLECAGKVVDLTDLMFRHDSNSRTVFFYAMQNDKLGIFEVLIRSLPDSLITVQDQRILNSLIEKDINDLNFITFGIEKQEPKCLKNYKEIPKVIMDIFGKEAVKTLLINSGSLSMPILLDTFSCLDHKEIQGLLQCGQHSKEISNASHEKASSSEQPSDDCYYHRTAMVPAIKSKQEQINPKTPVSGNTDKTISFHKEQITKDSSKQENSFSTCCSTLNQSSGSQINSPTTVNTYNFYGYSPDDAVAAAAALSSQSQM